MDNEKSTEIVPFDDDIGLYLEECGIHGEWLKQYINPEKMPKIGYTEVSRSDIGGLAMMIQHIPSIATNAMNTHGVYHVKWDKSLGDLQKAKQLGWLRSNVVDPSTNTDIKGQALLKPTSAGPLIANIAFSAISTITGQYFLSEINDKLLQIDKKLDSIRHFLEIEKQSALLANQYYINELINTLGYVQANELQKQANILQLQTIRRASYANMCFYTSMFKKKKEELNQLKSNAKKNIKKIPSVINEIGNNVLFYKFALYTYHLAYYLEILLSENTDSRYINHVKSDVKSKTDSYKSFVGYYTNEMQAFFNETKAYELNNALDVFTKVVGANAGFLLLRSPQLGIMVASAITSDSIEKKKEAQMEVINQVNRVIDDCQDCLPFSKIESSLDNYNRIVNHSKLELVYDDEKAYIKFTEIDDE